MNAFKIASNVGFVIALAGLGVTYYGFRFLLETNDLQKNGFKVKGKVVDIAQNGPMYRMPVVEFKTKEGQKIKFESRLQINHLMFKYVIGQEVEVIYKQPLSKPENREINAFWEQNMPQIFLGSFGVFLFLFGLFFRWLMLRKAKKYATS